jgi:RimJ/RimL family protein N-acetyltransferase
LLKPVTLEGAHVRLEPLSRDHLPGLLEVGLDPSLWNWTVTRVQSADDLRRYVETAIAEREQGIALPFATVWKESGKAIGSSRFGNIAAEHQRLEIGWTWIAPAWQRTAANTETKLLMLGHAFDTLQMRRVEFKTSSLNQRSREALRLIGAVEEGTLRRHTVNEDGTIRDTVYYSILLSEWPNVKNRLQRRLADHQR